MSQGRSIQQHEQSERKNEQPEQKTVSEQGTVSLPHPVLLPAGSKESAAFLGFATRRHFAASHSQCISSPGSIFPFSSEQSLFYFWDWERGEASTTFFDMDLGNVPISMSRDICTHLDPDQSIAIEGNRRFFINNGECFILQFCPEKRCITEERFEISKILHVEWFENYLKSLRRYRTEEHEYNVHNPLLVFPDNYHVAFNSGRQIVIINTRNKTFFNYELPEDLAKDYCMTHFVIDSKNNIRIFLRAFKNEEVFFYVLVRVKDFALGIVESASIPFTIPIDEEIREKEREKIESYRHYFLSGGLRDEQLLAEYVKQIAEVPKITFAKMLSDDFILLKAGVQDRGVVLLLPCKIAPDEKIELVAEVDDAGKVTLPCRVRTVEKIELAKGPMKSWGADLNGNLFVDVIKPGVFIYRMRNIYYLVDLNTNKFYVNQYNDGAYSMFRLGVQRYALVGKGLISFLFTPDDRCLDHTLYTPYLPAPLARIVVSYLEPQSNLSEVSIPKVVNDMGEVSHFVEARNGFFPSAEKINRCREVKIGRSPTLAEQLRVYQEAARAQIGKLNTIEDALEVLQDKLEVINEKEIFCQQSPSEAELQHNFKMLILNLILSIQDPAGIDKQFCDDCLVDLEGLNTYCETRIAFSHQIFLKEFLLALRGFCVVDEVATDISEIERNLNEKLVAVLNSLRSSSPSPSLIVCELNEWCVAAKAYLPLALQNIPADMFNAAITKSREQLAVFIREFQRLADTMQTKSTLLSQSDPQAIVDNMLGMLESIAKMEGCPQKLQEQISCMLNPNPKLSLALD